MEKFIPYEKLSKKKKRELDAGRRTLWAIRPVTRKPENPKAYHRKKAQKRMVDSDSVFSVSAGQAFEGRRGFAHRKTRRTLFLAGVARMLFDRIQGGKDAEGTNAR